MAQNLPAPDKGGFRRHLGLCAGALVSAEARGPLIYNHSLGYCPPDLLPCCCDIGIQRPSKAPLP